MSLDVSIMVRTGLTVCINGHESMMDLTTTEQMLDIVRAKYGDQNVVTSTRKEVWYRNITSNLWNMAENVEIDSDLTLYDLLWNVQGRFKDLSTSEALPLLEKALLLLKENPFKFKMFNPSNNFGKYEDLCEFVEEFIRACKQWPNAIIEQWS